MTFPGAPTTPRDGSRLRVLAAMSGGVDSAVAAARAAEAGHDVTGVHLALSGQPAVLPHRRPRLLHPGGLARRPPRRRRHRHPVLRVGPGRALPRGRGRGLRRRVRGRAHPQPVPALQREDQVRRAAGQGAGARLRRGVHRPLRDGRGARGRHPRAAPGRGHRQGPVLRARRAGRRQLAHAMFPLGDTRTTKDEIRAEAERRGLAVAHKPDSHDICFIADGDTQGFLAEPAGRRRGRHRRRGRQPARRPRRRVRLHHRPAQGHAHRQARPRTASRATSSTSPR